MTNKSAAAVSIVTWNHESVVQRCLQTLSQTVAPHYNVYVLDNASTDNTVELVQKFNFVHLIKLQHNSGFTGGNQTIWQTVADQGYDYLVLVNPDTVHDADWVSTIIEFMDAHPTVVIAQPKILLAQNPSKINTAGNALHYMGYSYCILQGQPDTLSDKPFPIAIASGAALVIRTNFLREHGFFDEAFFAYHEDTDLSIRAWQAGQEVFCVPAAKLQHEYVFSRSTKKLYYLERNRLYCLFKNFPIWYLVILAPTIFINEILMVILALTNGWIKQKLLSYIDLIKLLPTVYHYHRRSPVTRKHLRPVLQQLTWRIPVPEDTKTPKIFFKIMNLCYWLDFSILMLCLRLLRLS